MLPAFLFYLGLFFLFFADSKQTSLKGYIIKEKGILSVVCVGGATTDSVTKIQIESEIAS